MYCKGADVGTAAVLGTVVGHEELLEVGHHSGAAPAWGQSGV